MASIQNIKQVHFIISKYTSLKRGLLLLSICFLFLSCSGLNEVHQLYQLQQELEFSQIDSSMNFEGVELMSYYAIQLVLNFLFLIFALFLIVFAPVFLLFNWFTNFLKYKKLKLSAISLVSMNKTVSSSVFSQYKNSYAFVVGSGFGFLAWIFASIFYISKSYDQFGIGFIEYFNFPFKVLSNLSTENIIISNIVSSEVWLNMLLIVGVSAIHFTIGWYIGRLIINMNRSSHKIASNL